MHSTQRNIFRLVALLLALPVCTFAQQAAAPAPEVGRSLRVGLSGGETHLYRVALGAGQYLRALVEQQGMDVSVALTDPGGKRLLEVDSPNGSYGVEPLSIVVEDS